MRKLTEFESLFLQIIEYSNQVTAENYQEYAELGYDLLRKIHHLGMKETQVYERFFTYYDSLQDGMIKEWFAEMLDYILAGVIQKNIFGIIRNKGDQISKLLHW